MINIILNNLKYRRRKSLNRYGIWSMQVKMKMKILIMKLKINNILLSSNLKVIIHSTRTIIHKLIDNLSIQFLNKSTKKVKVKRKMKMIWKIWKELQTHMRIDLHHIYNLLCILSRVIHISNLTNWLKYSKTLLYGTEI